ncbi:MAG: hypothetical protein R2818_10940 [Flavobacteriales bacterium]
MRFFNNRAHGQEARIVHGRPHLLVAMAFLLLSVMAAQAQEEGGGPAEEGRHEIGLLVCHSAVSQGIDADGDRSWLVLPSWGLNYNYWLSERWAIGLHTDLISETFRVTEDLKEGEEKPVIERTRPVAPALMASYRPHEHWSFILGMGEEFAKEGNLTLMRAGMEYSIHLSGAWETSGSFAYDFRFDAYDSFTFGFGVARRF